MLPKLLLFAFCFFLVANTFAQFNPNLTYGEMKDVDGNTYKTIKIGNQTWMAENLDVTRFRNGDPIPEAKTIEQYQLSIENGTPMWCYYDFDSTNAKTYGKIYNFYAVKDKRGLAPIGWKIPAKRDWETLITFLGGEKSAEIKLKSNSGWLYSGNNSSGFSAVPGGILFDGAPYFSGKGEAGNWWSSSTTNDGIDAAHTLSLYNKNTLSTDPIVMWLFVSVRCLKSL